MAGSEGFLSLTFFMLLAGVGMYLHGILDIPDAPCLDYVRS
jgi:hypothetical protein